MSLFPSIFGTIAAFSLYGEYAERSFLPNGVFLLLCDHGLDFLHQSAHFVRIQSINQLIIVCLCFVFTVFVVSLHGG